jgi:carboxyl-terminal processing protease
MVRNQLQRTSIAPAYDLDFDIQLKAALEILAGGQFKSLMSSTLSVRDYRLQPGSRP